MYCKGTLFLQTLRKLGSSFTLSVCETKTLEAKGQEPNITHLFYKIRKKAILHRWQKASSKYKLNLPLPHNK